MTTMVSEMSGDRLIKLDTKSPVRFVGLASILAVAFILFQILWPLRWNLVALWVAIEFLFYTFYWRPRWAELNKQPVPHRPRAHNAMKAFRRTLKYFKETPGIDTDMYYSGWFMGAKFEDIKRGNAEEFMAYAFWYRTMQEMADEGRGHVPAEMVDELEEAWRVKIAPGYTPGINFMGHLWEPLKASWRPLAFYIATETVGWFARQLLKRWGFQQHTHKGMSYFTLNMRSKTATATRSNSSSSSLSDASVASALSGSAAAATAPAPAAAAVQPRAVPEAAKSAKSSPPAILVFATSGAASAAAAAHASGMMRAKSSPFEAAGFDWAAQLAADADFLAASITAASAVHSPVEPIPQPNFAAAAVAAASRSTAAAVAGRSSSKRKAGQPSQAPAAAAAGPNSALLTPWLSTHTSVMLKANPNPLEDALEDGLGSKDMPVLFLHGVGGLPAYLEMMLQVMALGHPVIVVQFNAVAMRLGKVDTADEVVETVVGMLDKLGVEEACVIGHSYGTFVAGRLARLHRKRVHSLCLIDPVCFGMFMPQLLANFLYKAPQWRGLHHFVDYVKKAGVYMASHELHVCATFSRGFFWSDLNLWPEDVAPGSVVLLSGCDDLMNARQVQEMLERSGHIKVHYNHELTHGEFLIKSEVKQAIMAELRGMLARSGSAVVGLARPVLETTMTLARNALGVTGTVRMHTGHGGSKYVEDHTNKLVRTFTGNLTATLQTTPSTTRPAFNTRSNSATSGGSASTHTRSRFANRDWKSLGGMATNASNGGAAQQLGSASVGGAALPGKAVASSGGLSQAFSLPVKRKLTREQWLKKVLGGGNESNDGSCTSTAKGASAASHAHSKKQGPASPRHAVVMSNLHLPKQSSLKVARRGSGGAREGRRSSGSGGVQRKVVVMSDGVEVVPGTSIPEGSEDSI